MPNSPTIVSAALSDKELQDSINRMVANFDKGLQTMLEHSNEYVGKIQESLQKIGNTNFGAKGSNDGGVAKQTKAQEEFTESVKRSTNEIKKHGKESEMTFDQIANALSQARRTVSDFNTKRASGILPSSDDYKRYEQALARIVEYNDKLKQSALGKAFGNEQAFAFDGKRVVSDITAVDERLKQLGKYYAELEKQSQRTSSSINKQLEDEVGRRNIVIEQMRAYYKEQERLSKEAAKIQNKEFREQFKGALSLPVNDILDAYRKLDRLKALLDEMRNKKKDKIVDISEADINRVSNAITSLRSKIDKMYEQRAKAREKESAAQKKLIDDQYKLAFARTAKIPTDQLDLAQAKLERLQALLRDMRERGILSNAQIASTEAEIRKLEQIIGQVNTAQQQTTQSAQRYTEEIRKQLASITSKKDATKAFEQISIMPSNTMDEIKAKGQALVELVKKVKDTPLMSQSNVKLAEKMIGSLANQYRALKEEKEKVANTQTINATAENTTRRSLEQEKQDLERLKALQEERRQQIIQTGIAAQQQARILRESIGQQMQSADYTKQVDKVKELQNALTEMKNAYKQPIDSSIKKSLEEDIAITQKALDIAKRYNMTVAGLGAVGVGGKAPTDTLAAYSAEAQRLAGIYKNLSTEERSASAGQGLKRKYQELSRTASQVRKELERPINLKDAMKGGESTIDDLAYKIQRLQSYKRGLDFKTQAGEIQEVDNKIKSLNSELNKYLATAKNVQSQNTALGRSWNYMKNRLAFYFTVGASTQFVKNLIEVRSQYEMNERALGILIDSAERGTQIFNELSQMALVSPYTLIELSAAAKQLTAYDVAAKDVVDTTRRLADMASAVGIPIERLTYALGQIKAYGYLNSRDARMFANAGIPLVKQLSEYYTELEGRLVSTADVYDRIKKKSIDYSDVMQVINHMTDEGGKFFDFQAKMADTLKVRLANLTLAWNNMLNDMGKESQGVLTWGIGALRELFLQWRTFDKTLKEAAGAFGLYKAIQLIILGLQTATKSTLGLNARLTATGVLGTRLVTIFKTLGGTMKALAANWWLVLVAAAVELSSAIINANEATKEFNKSMREGAESTANDLKKYIEQYKDLRDSLYKKEILEHGNGKAGYRIVPQDIEKNEANKAWEAMREQIELSSAASTDFVSRLLQIENVSDRLREGFKIIDDIQQVNAALKDMDDEALVVTQKWSAWWNAWQAPDGLFTNLKEFKVELDEIRQKYGDIANARYVAEHGDINRAENEQDAIMRAASEAVNDYDREMNRFRVDLDKYTSSLDNFANAMEFSSNPTQVAELYAKAVKQLVTQGQLNPQEAFDLQLQIEEARTNAMKLALRSRIADEEAALKLAQDERTKETLNASIESNEAQLKLFENSTYEQTAYWNDFTKYIKERHISELSAAYNAMTDNGKKQMDFQSAEWQNYVHKWANSYEKSHNLATDSVFNRIKNWINDANTWSIFIKMTISTEDKKSVYKELGEWDKAADDAYKTMQRLDKEISRLRKKGAKEVGVMPENNASADDKKLTQAIEERTQAQKDYNEAIANGGESKKKDAAGRKAQKAAETELQKALKDELSTIEKVRSIYKDLTKEGMSHANAVERATKGWNETVNAINKVLTKNGLQKLDLSKFAGIENPRELVNMLQSQLNTLLKRGAKPAEIKELQTKVNTLEVDADKYDLTKITKGLNNELGKLKDEYELAVALDADPELGNVFANMMGIDIESLPHTVKEYADEYSKYLNKYLKGKNSTMQLTGDELRGLTRDDINALQSQVDDGTFNQEWFDAIKKAYDDISGKRKKDLEETEKWKNSLIEKYGNLQDKLTKIYKDSVQNQVNAVKTFGTEGQKSEIIRLQARIEATDNPAELSELNNRIAEIVKDVTDKNPIALKIVSSSKNQTESDVSKAYWEDFKNSDMYTMTFEDMANNSTRAIQLIIDKLNGLKDKVKEDPASMKALIKSLEDAEKELNARDPFGGIARSLKNMEEASKETKDAQEALWRAEVDVEQAQQAYDNAEDGTPEEREAAQKALASAIQKRTDAQNNLTKAENKGKKAQENLKSSLQGVTGQLGNVKSLFDTVSSLFRAGGDDETADAIDAISEGFSIMTTVIMGVVAAMVLLESSQPWLLAIAAALSVIVGLVKFLSGNDNEKIDDKIKESELAVKRLENSYKRLQAAVDEAYGTMKYAAEQAAIANKKAQLAEMRRQLNLEQSRDSKDRDDDKIASIQGQIIDLQQEIEEATKNIINDMLGITSVGDAAEQMVSSMIDAFRSGEDYMKSFSDSFEDMIDNMIMKAIVSRIIGKRLESLWNEIDSKAEERGADAQAEINRLVKERQKQQDIVDSTRYFEIAHMTAEHTIEDLDRQIEEAKKRYEKAIEPTTEDVNGIRTTVEGWKNDVKSEFEAWMAAFGVSYGDRGDKNLSNLQQGIAGVSEETASAVEAYLNGMSQQAYLRNDLLTQIRDAVVGIDIDVQVATQAQMLLQLQQSYAVQMTIQGILEGVLNPSGRAFSVELLS